MSRLEELMAALCIDGVEYKKAAGREHRKKQTGSKVR